MKLLNFMTLVMRKEEAANDPFSAITDAISSVTDKMVSSITSIGSAIQIISFSVAGLVLLVLLLGMLFRSVMNHQENVVTENIPKLLIVIGISAAIGIVASVFNF